MRLFCGGTARGLIDWRGPHAVLGIVCQKKAGNVRPLIEFVLLTPGRTRPFGGTYHPRVAQPSSTECPVPAVLAAGVVLASGSGTRVGGSVNKVYLTLAGRPVASWSLATLAATPGIGVLVLMIRPADRSSADNIVADPALAGVEIEVVHGGATRQESELLALRALAGRISTGRIDTVLIHDAARPLVSPELVATVLATAREFGGAIPGLPRADLVPVTSDTVTGPPLERVVTVQTPQGFRSAAGGLRAGGRGRLRGHGYRGLYGALLERAHPLYRG
jgi:2-C-methyl-D-erythritol 4-phosphate cytidylyltransferase